MAYLRSGAFNTDVDEFPEDDIDLGMRTPRGWAMRNGHAKRLSKLRKGGTKAPGRAAFARTVNSRPRCREVIWASQAQRRDARADLQWELKQLHDEELYCEQVEVGEYCEDWTDESLVIDAASEYTVPVSRDITFSGCLSNIDVECWCAKFEEAASQWDVACARAKAAAEKYVSMAKCKVKRHKAPLSEFSILRNMFLTRYGEEIREAVTRILGNGAELVAAELAAAVEQRFLDACGTEAGTWPDNLCPAYHGTAAPNHALIFKSGLLIPGEGNNLKVKNGIVYGKGIYTTNSASISTSRAYCSEPRMLVCGLLDVSPEGDETTVSHYTWGKVVRDASRVVPFFEAIASGPVSSSAAKKTNYSYSNGAARLLQALASTDGISRRAPQSSVTSKGRATSSMSHPKRHCARRAARKRSLCKASSKQF